jgi:hypothetical protein
MAIPYETLVPEISPYLYGCPDFLIENNIRSAVIELCERASVYQAELDPITTVSGLYEYDFEPPAGTAVQKILWVTHEGKDLEPISSALLEQRIPKWRSSGNSSTPAYFVKQSSSLFWLAPTPPTTIPNSTIIRAVLKPTHTSSACDDDVMNDYRDAIVNGALFRLLRIPNKDWTDLKGANNYGMLFTSAIIEAERRARQADTGIARTVNYGGVKGAWKTRRNRYGREFG